MEDRLLKLLDTEQLSSSKFADVIGVQRSSVSHILTGRNKPSFDFLQKTLKAFPMLNADWLILGEGEMYEGAHGPGGGNLFDLPAPSTVPHAGGTGQSAADQVSQSSTSTLQEANISDDASDRPENSRQGGDVAVNASDRVSGQQVREGHSAPGEAVQHQDTVRKDTHAASVEKPGESPGASRDHDGKISVHASTSSKRVRRVILFYDDNSFEAYDQA